MSRHSTIKAAFLVERTVRSKLKLFYRPKTKFMSKVKIAILIKNDVFTKMQITFFLKIAIFINKNTVSMK